MAKLGDNKPSDLRDYALQRKQRSKKERNIFLPKKHNGLLSQLSLSQAAIMTSAIADPHYATTHTAALIKVTNTDIQTVGFAYDCTVITTNYR